jgi:hypothetical protein
MTRRRGFALLAIEALLLAACSNGSSIATPTTAAGTPAAGSGVGVLVPGGWSSRDLPSRGLVVAMRADDVEAETPEAPRFIASPSQGDLPDPADLFATTREQNATIRGAPTQVTVGGIDGVAVESESTVGGITIVSRRVVVPIGAGQAEIFILEAPKDQWDASQATLEGILASVSFTTPVIAAPGS